MVYGSKISNKLSLAAKNGVVYELWQSIGTAVISTLKEDPRFPINPDKVEVLPNFESAKNFADHYGARLKTYYRVRFFENNTSKNYHHSDIHEKLPNLIDQEL